MAPLKTQRIFLHMLVVGLMGTLCPAFATDSGFSAEQEMNLNGVVWVTFASACVTAIVSVGHYWHSKMAERMIILQSVSSVLVVTFVCFLVSLIPLMKEVSMKDAMIVLYFPSIILAVLLLAISMWVRSIVEDLACAYTRADDFSSGIERVKRIYSLWRRDCRIERSKRNWARKEAQRQAMELKARMKKHAGKKRLA